MLGCTCDDGDGDESEPDLPLLDRAVPRLQLHQPHLDMVNIPGEVLLHCISN